MFFSPTAEFTEQSTAEKKLLTKRSSHKSTNPRSLLFKKKKICCKEGICVVTALLFFMFTSQHKSNDLGTNESLCDK